MGLTNEQVLAKLKEEYCKTISTAGYSVAGNKVVKQKLAVLAKEIAAYERRLHEEGGDASPIKTFYL